MNNKKLYLTILFTALHFLAYCVTEDERFQNIDGIKKITVRTTLYYKKLILNKYDNNIDKIYYINENGKIEKEVIYSYLNNPTEIKNYSYKDGLLSEITSNFHSSYGNINDSIKLLNIKKFKYNTNNLLTEYSQYLCTTTQIPSYKCLLFYDEFDKLQIEKVYHNQSYCSNIRNYIEKDSLHYLYKEDSLYVTTFINGIGTLNTSLYIVDKYDNLIKSYEVDSEDSSFKKEYNIYNSDNQIIEKSIQSSDHDINSNILQALNPTKIIYIYDNKRLIEEKYYMNRKLIMKNNYEYE